MAVIYSPPENLKVIQNFKFSDKPEIIYQNRFYAVLYKPGGLPTAPLKEDEQNTLLSWFLSMEPEAANIYGKKKIEAGLIHRLDTPTCGLVLAAKTQDAFEILSFMQENNLIEKTYYAFCNMHEKTVPNFIESQFRPFGVKGKMAAPVFSSSKKFKKEKKMYRTNIISVDAKDNISSVTCSLTQGYRHQVRTHLASIGLPICGDALYNANFKKDFPYITDDELQKHLYPLQLYAVGISFPDFKNVNILKNVNCNLDRRISFLLPPPNKMIL